MQTDSTSEVMQFEGCERRRVVAAIDGREMTSEAGALLLRQADRVLDLSERVAGCFEDHRCQELVEHSVRAMVVQRIAGIALGYEDVNDHDDLRRDPVLGLLADKLEAKRGDCEALAGKSTLNRLEHGRPGEVDRYHKISHDPEALETLFVDLFLDAHGRAPKRITLDLDATDDPLHGNQEGRFFHGYYRHYCYLPLYIFCGRHLLAAKLRTSNIDGAAGAKEELERIVGRIRQRWPEVKILVRADSGFAREDLMAWCEANGVDYLFGLAKNKRLIEEISLDLAAARARFEETGAPARRFKDFSYRTLESWSRARRVVGKAEHLPQGANPRFVVTSLSRGEHRAKELYEKLYCARGEMENRIKECQLDLFADRTSAASLRANQLRLWFASFAYVLMEGLRRIALHDSALADATCGTIRLKLLKLAARITISVRRIKLSMASACPYQRTFAIAQRRLAQAAA